VTPAPTRLLFPAFYSIQENIPMKFGDPVIYVEGGKEYLALVVGTRSLEHHEGENDEPLLNLAFVKEVLDGAGNVRNVTGTVREPELVQFRHDIAHESHAFSDEAREALTKSGNMYPGGEIPGGRWREIPEPGKPSADVSKGDSAPAIPSAQASTQAPAGDNGADAGNDSGNDGNDGDGGEGGASGSGSIQ
jgi:hypothetical protein